MKLFNSKEAAPMTTGTDVLREALRVRIRKGSAALLARDLGAGTATLDEFAHGRGTLPLAIMNTLAKNLFGDSCSFDAQRDLLTRTKQVATPIGTAPPRFVPKAPPVLGPSAWPPIIPDKPQPQPKQTRAGWAQD